MGRMAAKKAGGRRARRQFTNEFKAGVRLVPGKQARANRDGGKSGLTTEECAELAELRKQVRQLRIERDILTDQAHHDVRFGKAATYRDAEQS